MNDILLNQADGLMRRRSFIAGSKSAATQPSWREAETGEEDIPVLTDKIVLPLASDANAAPETAGQEQLARLIREKQDFLTREIEAWLDEQMPQLVIRAMDGITDHLIALLANRTRDELLPRLEDAFRKSSLKETD